MTTDLDTLRRHERALVGDLEATRRTLRSNSTAACFTPAAQKARDMNAARLRDKIDALAWALDHCRAEIAKWFHLERMEDGVWWMRIGDAMVNVDTTGAEPVVHVDRGEY